MLFNEMLMKRRRELGLTQDELAEKLNISRQSISRWENGECMPESDKLIKLSEILGVSLDELTGREVKVEPIVLEAPVIPKPKKDRIIRTAAVCALCAVCAAAGMLIGRYLIPREKTAPREQVQTMPEIVTSTGFRIVSQTHEGELTASFVSNTSREGTVYFYPAGGAAPVSAGTTYKDGTHSFTVKLKPNVEYEKVIFTVSSNGLEYSSILLSHLMIGDDGSASYSEASDYSGFLTAVTADQTAMLPANGDAECAEEMLGWVEYPEELFRVPFDRERTYGEMLAHVQMTYPELDEVGAARLAEQMTDAWERAESTAAGKELDGLRCHTDENGALIVDIGRVVNGVLVDP